MTPNTPSPAAGAGAGAGAGAVTATLSRAPCLCHVAQVGDLFAVHRSNYENTSFDATAGLAAGAYGQPNRSALPRSTSPPPPCPSLAGSSPPLLGPSAPHLGRTQPAWQCALTTPRRALALARAAGCPAPPRAHARYGSGSFANGSGVSGNWERTLSIYRTTYSQVVQARAWLPDAVGGTVWWGPSKTKLRPSLCGARS